MAETITRALELHNPYALEFSEIDDAQSVTIPTGAFPGGLKQTAEFWRYGKDVGGVGFIDSGNGELTRHLYRQADDAGNGYSFHVLEANGKLRVRFAETPMVQFADPNNEYMTFPAYNPMSNNFTIELLVRNNLTNPVDWSKMLSFGHSVGDSAMHLLFHSSNYWYWQITDADNNSVYPGINQPGKIGDEDMFYHHHSLTVDRTGEIGRYYIDGVEQDGSQDISTLTDDIAIDLCSLARNFSGGGGSNIDVAYLRIWSDVRTPDEIADNQFVVMQNGEAGLERNYTFDDLDETDFEGGQDGTFAGAPTVNKTYDQLDITISDEEMAGWHHYGFLHKASQAKGAGVIYFFFDGPTHSYTHTADGRPCYYANGSYGGLRNRIYGKIGEIRFWNSLKWEAQIKSKMFSELVGDEAGLNACYKFDEKSGTTLGDSTANDYDGTITLSDADWVAGCPVQGSGWEDITVDLLPDYGFLHYQGSDDALNPLSRVANPGKLQGVLNNSVKNSASTLGLYSPGHGSVRDGFIHGAGLRVKYTYNGTTRIFWQGRIYNIDPDSELKGSNTTYIEAFDWMFEASKQKVRGLLVQTNKRGDQALESALAVMPIGKQPTETDFDVGLEESNYIFDTERDDRTKISGICRRVALTEYGRITMDGRKLLFLNRHAMVSETVVQHDFDDNEPGVTFLRTQYPERGVFTRVKAKSHPRYIDSDATTVLAVLNTAIWIGAGATETTTLRYRDPDSATRISANDLHADFPEEGVDYIAKANEDGTGSNLSSDLVITIILESANSIELSIYNGGAQTAWTGGTAGTFQVRGQGMYRFDPAWSESVASQELLDKYGDRELEYDIPYGDNPLTADGYSTYILDQTKVPRLDIGGVEYYPEVDADLAAAFIGTNMAQRLTLARAMLNLDADFFIIKIEVQAEDKRLKCIYKVEAADSSAYLKLNDNIYAVLDAPVSRLAF